MQYITENRQLIHIGPFQYCAILTNGYCKEIFSQVLVLKLVAWLNMFWRIQDFQQRALKKVIIQFTGSGYVFLFRMRYTAILLVLSLVVLMAELGDNGVFFSDA